MTISSQKYAFTQSNIDTYAPASAGVYGLYDGAATIYYGEGSSIRARLKSHKNGYEGSCTQGAAQFNWEVTSRHEEREKELLKEHKQLHGKLPRCNERVG